MISKITIALSAVLVQIISAQYIARPYNGINVGMAAAENAAIANSMGYVPMANSLGYSPIAANSVANGVAYANAAGNALANNLAYDAAIEATPLSYTAPASGLINGGAFRVTSSSPIAASGVTVQSENLLIEGPLAVSGQMPFTGVVGLEGPLPAIGQGSVAYSAGNGNVGIVSEGLEAGYSNGLSGDAVLPAYNNKGYAALY